LFDRASTERLAASPPPIASLSRGRDYPDVLDRGATVGAMAEFLLPLAAGGERVTVVGPAKLFSSTI
jgi:hypothetical protein